MTVIYNKIIWLTIFLSILLISCGQSGPLYLP
ncbi:MAG: lipoprotein [Gammaproteobacteria bacterium]